MPKQVAFYRSLLLQRMLAAGLLVLAVGAMWLGDEYIEGHRRIDQLKQEAMARSEDRIRIEVERAERMIDLARERAEADLAAHLRNQTDHAYDVAQSMYRELIDEHPRAVVEQAIIEALRSIRFNEGRGYYFIGGMDGVSRLWPTVPDREGTDILDLRDRMGRPLVRELITIARDQGAGFSRYAMVKPGSPGDDHEKWSYIRRFEPFDWYIGCGEYLEDHIATVQQQVLEELERIGPQELAYYFVATWDGDVLLGPGRGQNMLTAGSPAVQAVVHELIATAKAGSGLVRYTMPTIGDQVSESKLSYVAGIPEWRWYVGAGTGLGPLEEQVAALAAEQWSSIRWHMALVAGLLVGALGMVWFVSQMTVRRVTADITAIRRFLAAVAGGSAAIDDASLRYQEFAEIARSGTAMLQALRRSEGSFRGLVDQAPVPVLVIDEGGGIEALNPRFTAVFGYALADMPTLTACWERLIPDERQRARVVDRWLAVVGGEGGLADVSHASLDVAVESRDGSQRDIEIAVTVLDGRQILVFQDLTERVQAQRELERQSRELRDARAQLLAAIEHSPAGIAIAEAPDCHFIVENKAAKAMRGVGEDADAPPAEDLRFFHADGRPMAFDESPLLRAIRHGEVVSNEEFIFQRDDEQRVLLANAAPIHDDQGVCRAGIVIFHDITEQRETEQQLRQIQKLESIGQLAGGVAHDFNNQLAGIQGFAELLQLSALDERQRGFVERLLQACHRCADLTNQLLAFARKGDYQRRPIDIHRLIGEVVGMLERTIDRRISIDCDLRAGQATVICDATQMQNAFLNLGLNARDAMGAGGHLRFATAIVEEPPTVGMGSDLPPGRYLTVAISDTGHGIEPAIRERIFEPFFTTKELGAGTGMGLPAAHGTVRGAGGDITVTSEVGAGTCFTIYLPLSDAQEEESTAVATIPDGGSAHVLLVDDEELVCEVTAAMLHEAGYQTSSCRSGGAAVAMLEARGAGAFDLIILDMIMPGMGGRETYAALRRIDPRVPVLIASGYSLAGEAHDLQRAGVAGLLNKPVSRASLLAEVERVLALSD